MSQLVFEYRYDESFFDARLTPDDFGRLTVSVVTDQFSGTGGWWVQWQEVREFGESLSAFPIPPDKPLKAEWEATRLDNHVPVDRAMIIGVKIGPANLTGDLLVRVEITDDDDWSRRVCTSFLTNYPDLEAFGRSIANLMDRRVDKAILRGQ